MNRPLVTPTPRLVTLPPIWLLPLGALDGEYKCTCLAAGSAADELALIGEGRALAWAVNRAPRSAHNKETIIA